MTGAIDVLTPDAPKRVVIVASNPAVSEQTGWPIGFWWAELSHPYWELTEHGYDALLLVGGQRILITGQQQYSDTAAARLIVEALGV